MAGSIFDGVDMSDPCAVWPKLQQVLDRLLAGEMVVRARFGEDETQFQQSSIADLNARIKELKRECAAKQSRRPVRHAIRGGFIRY